MNWTPSELLAVFTLAGLIGGIFYRMGRYGHIIERTEKHIHEINNWRSSYNHRAQQEFANKEVTEAKFEAVNERIDSNGKRIDHVESLVHQR